MRSERLLTLLLLLQTRERSTIPELARELGVSERTILRDLRALEDADLPVVVQRGRYGGVAVLPGAQLDLARLGPSEVEALRLLGLDETQLDAIGLGDAAAGAARKLRSRRAPTVGRRRALADFVLVDNRGWLAPEPGSERAGTSPAELVDALRDGVRLRLDYRSSARPRATRRTVDPYGLLAKSGRWYLVARQDAEDRLFALERLAAWEATTTPARLPPGAVLAEVAEQLVARLEAPRPIVVTGHLAADRLDIARRILGSRLEIEDGVADRIADATADADDDGAGRVAVRIRVDRIEAVRQLLQFGDRLEVTAPREARDELAATARRVVALYAADA